MSRNIYYDDSSEKNFMYWEVSGFTLGLLGGSIIIQREDNVVFRIITLTTSTYMGVCSAWLFRYLYQYNKRIPYYLAGIGLIGAIIPYLKKTE